MPADEPTPWELQRGQDRIWQAFNEIVARAEKHISTESLAALLAPIRQELAHISEELASERSFRQGDVTAIKDWAKVEHARLQEWADDAITRIEAALEKEAEEQRRRDEERKKDEREARSERRADRRVIYGGALAGASGLLLWVLDKWPG